MKDSADVPERTGKEKPKPAAPRPSSSGGSGGESG